MKSGIFFPVNESLAAKLKLVTFSQFSSLPLLGVRTKARIINFLTYVELEQDFTNPFDELLGVVKEKEEARREYVSAIKAGKVASLLEQQLPDVSQVSIGNIPPKQLVRVRISYITELNQESEENEIRFALPAILYPRYGYDQFQSSGQVGSSFVGYGYSNAFKVPFSIQVGVEMSSGPIQSVSSPSHPIQMILGKSIEDEEINCQIRSDIYAALAKSTNAEMHRAIVEFSTDEVYLEKDFILHVKAGGLDNPTCILEPLVMKNQLRPHHAMMLTLTPRFALNEIRSELIFVIDRSGSMAGSSMEQTKKALHVFLRSIPQLSYFNIIGFGSKFSSLFPSSVEYNHQNFTKAVQYTDEMSADYGGTEILSPLSHIFRNRRRDMPTQVFLLTDGEVWNVDEIISTIRNSMNTAKGTTSFIRIFTIGIGNGVSRHLVESISRAGGGYTQYVAAGERMEKKVIKMLKNAVLPPLSNLQVKWPDIFEKSMGSETSEDFELVDANEFREEVHRVPPKSMSFFNKHVIPPRKRNVAERPNVIQAPNNIPQIFSGSRFIVCAMFNGYIKSYPRQISVKLSATSPDGPIEIVVPATLVNGGRIIHTLAARKLIRDLEEGTSYLNHPPQSPGGALDYFQKQEIINLGVKYSLASKYTSCIATDFEIQAKDQNPMPRLSEDYMRRMQFLSSGNAVKPSNIPTLRIPILQEDSRRSSVNMRDSERANTESGNLTDLSEIQKMIDDLQNQWNGMTAGSSETYESTVASSNTSSPNQLSSPVSRSSVRVDTYNSNSQYAAQYQQYQQQTSPPPNPKNIFSGSNRPPVRSPPQSPTLSPMRPNFIPTIPNSGPTRKSYSSSDRSDTIHKFSSDSNTLVGGTLQSTQIPGNVSSSGRGRSQSTNSYNQSGSYESGFGNYPLPPQPLFKTLTETDHETLVRLQNFDGSYELNEFLASLFGATVDFCKRFATEKNIPQTIQNTEGFHKIWATIIATTTFETQFTSSRDIWEFIVSKSKQFVRNSLFTKLPNRSPTEIQQLVDKWTLDAKEFIRVARLQSVPQRNCDGCQAENIPVCYNCKNCTDFDFCGACYQSKRFGHTRGHEFVRMVMDKQYTSWRVCDCCGASDLEVYLHCYQCHDFDFCFSCYNSPMSNHDPAHTFSQLKTSERL